MSGLGLAILPLFLQLFGDGWVRLITVSLIYVMLAIGLNIVVGYAGLLDLGFVAFFALGAYIYGWFNSGQLLLAFPSLAAWFPNGLHTPFWIVIPVSILITGITGMILGAPTLRLRGDYLAIVTLGFGEIIRIFMNNLDAPINLTNGPQGISVDRGALFGHPLSQSLDLGFVEVRSVSLYYYFLLVIVALAIVVSIRLHNSRLGRAWIALREDEIAAKAMGIHVRNVKLMAFGLGATFGGVAGCFFASLQGFISPESFVLMESVMLVAMVVLGGMGHIPGVVLGAFLLSALPEVLRYVSSPLQSLTDGRIDAAILRQLLVAVAMVAVMLWRPHGLWPKK
ncbi:MAG: ABC transporter ATP-binding protein [Gammaproteobacteria bacterium]|nr:ABC transporter ATP-binding protein [Gammaproteobacteria bacterium]